MFSFRCAENYRSPTLGSGSLEAIEGTTATSVRSRGHLNRWSLLSERWSIVATDWSLPIRKWPLRAQLRLAH